MVWDSGQLPGALTPKFYVALTGTSSLISGLILIFEWWYFRKYGTSFIEMVSVTHLGPWLGNGGPEEAPNLSNNANNSANNIGSECKVGRNPMALLRGAEYARYGSAARKPPLTYFDMNLSAQEHQSWFCCGAEGPVEEAMSRAWRERDPTARVAAARAALECDPDCAAALLLLAEEDTPTVSEADRVLKRAWRAAEATWRAHSAGGTAGTALARRDAAVLAHVKRRVAMCARRLGRLRDAARLFRELVREAPPSLHPLWVHENLLEVLLEQRLYADAAALIVRLEETGAAPTATLVYTAALLRARVALAAPARSLIELAALEACRRAIEYNPYVPEYLLEMRALSLPPEHVMRRGDSEALAYSFSHLRHWTAAEGALRVLATAAHAGGGAGGAPGAAGRGAKGQHGGGSGGTCATCADRELLAAQQGAGGGGGGAGAARGRRGALVPAAAALCALTALLALAAHGWPAHAQALLDPGRLHALLTAV